MVKHLQQRMNVEDLSKSIDLSMQCKVIDNLTNIAQNTEAARSRILDTDYAKETTELARTQIIQQAAMAMLTQANQQTEQILELLKSVD